MKFIVNVANDVPEVFRYILCEILAKCPDSSELIFSTSFKVDRSCDVCFSSVCTDEQVSRLRVPVRSTIQLSIQYFSKSSHLDGPSQSFCDFCGINQDATTDISLSSKNFSFFTLFGSHKLGHRISLRMVWQFTMTDPFC